MSLLGCPEDALMLPESAAEATRVPYLSVKTEPFAREAPFSDPDGNDWVRQQSTPTDP